MTPRIRYKLNKAFSGHLFNSLSINRLSLKSVSRLDRSFLLVAPMTSLELMSPEVFLRGVQFIPRATESYEEGVTVVVALSTIDPSLTQIIARPLMTEGNGVTPQHRFRMQLEGINSHVSRVSICAESGGSILANSVSHVEVTFANKWAIDYALNQSYQEGWGYSFASDCMEGVPRVSKHTCPGSNAVMWHRCNGSSGELRSVCPAYYVDLKPVCGLFRSYRDVNASLCSPLSYSPSQTVCKCPASMFLPSHPPSISRRLGSTELTFSSVDLVGSTGSQKSLLVNKSTTWIPKNPKAQSGNYVFICICLLLALAAAVCVYSFYIEKESRFEEALPPDHSQSTPAAVLLQALPPVLRPGPLFPKVLREISSHHRWLCPFFRDTRPQDQITCRLVMLTYIVTVFMVNAVVYTLSEPDDDVCDVQGDCGVRRSALHYFEQRCEQNGIFCRIRSPINSLSSIFIAGFISGLVSIPINAITRGLITDAICRFTRKDDSDGDEDIIGRLWLWLESFTSHAFSIPAGLRRKTARDFEVLKVALYGHRLKLRSPEEIRSFNDLWNLEALDDIHFKETGYPTSQSVTQKLTLDYFTPKLSQLNPKMYPRSSETSSW
jgi:hypothetical protein